jgi:hypothetical protein
MEQCQQGFHNVEELFEADMVSTSCGCHAPGTPDGGFRDSAGLLRLVQVVRVPLLPGMDADEAAEILYDTVLTKIVKSQAWMKQTGILPHDFIIFCWLPAVEASKVFTQETDALLWTEALMWNVRSGGWPFSLRVETPIDPGGLFPRSFGTNSLFKNQSIRSKMQSYQDALSCFLNPQDFEDEDDDEAMEWCLFGEDLEEATDQHTIVDEPTDLLALLLNAIQAIEQGKADGDQDAANAMPNLPVILLEPAELNQRGEEVIAADPAVRKEFRKPPDSARSWCGLEYKEPPDAGRSWWDMEYHASPRQLEFVTGFCDSWQKDDSMIESVLAVRPARKYSSLGMPPVIEQVHGVAADVWRFSYKLRTKKDVGLEVRWDMEPFFHERNALALLCFIFGSIMDRCTFSHAMLYICLGALV